MNSTLRKAIHRKHMLYSNYTKQRNGENWEKYRKQTNLVNKLKKKNYFLESHLHFLYLNFQILQFL
jgi:hypothetical protein